MIGTKCGEGNTRRPYGRAMVTVLSALVAVAVGDAAQGVELPFATAVATSRDIVRERILEGQVEAVKEATVSAQTSGRVVEIYFDVDDFVPKGSVIVRLRDTEQRARLERAEAELRAAEARYAEVQRHYRRLSDLVAHKAVSQAEWDAAKGNLDSSKARLEAAQAALREAREQLAHTVVRAPYSGVVSKRHIEVGEAASPGQPLMSGFSLEHLRVRVEVPQQLIQAVRSERKARVLLPDTAKDAVSAEQLTIFPYASTGSNTFTVRIDLPPRVEGLLPGMLVKVAFVVGRRTRLAVPAQAVVYRSEVVGVYVVKPDGAVTLRQIRPGRLAEDDMIEVLAGLSEGERIALDPVRAGVYLKELGSGTRR